MLLMFVIYLDIAGVRTPGCGHLEAAIRVQTLARDHPDAISLALPESPAGLPDNQFLFIYHLLRRPRAVIYESDENIYQLPAH